MLGQHPDKAKILNDFKAKWRRERDSNPRYGFPYTRVPGVRLQPLGHLSVPVPPESRQHARGSSSRIATECQAVATTFPDRETALKINCPTRGMHNMHRNPFGGIDCQVPTVDLSSEEPQDSQEMIDPLSVSRPGDLRACSRRHHGRHR